MWQHMACQSHLIVHLGVAVDSVTSADSPRPKYKKRKEKLHKCSFFHFNC